MLYLPNLQHYSCSKNIFWQYCKGISTTFTCMSANNRYSFATLPLLRQVLNLSINSAVSRLNDWGSSYSTFYTFTEDNFPPSAHYRAGHIGLNMYTKPASHRYNITSVNTKIYILYKWYITLVQYMRLPGFIPAYLHNANTIPTRLHAGLLI